MTVMETKQIPATLCLPAGGAAVNLKPLSQKKGRRRSQYAFESTKHEITLPEFKPTGYLTQSRDILRAQSGDVEAKKRVWLNNSRLAYTVANSFRIKEDKVADSIQSGLIGLSKAIDKFDVDRLNEFSTYAYPSIRSHLIRNAPKAMFSTRIADYLYSKYLVFRKQISSETNRNRWYDNREQYLYRAPEEYEQLLRLHAIACPDELSSASLFAPKESAPLTKVVSDEQNQAFQNALNSCCPQSQFVLSRRYGLGNTSVMTLSQVGDALGLTRERIRQLQIKAEDELKKALETQGFTDVEPIAVSATSRRIPSAIM